MAAQVATIVWSMLVFAVELMHVSWVFEIRFLPKMSSEVHIMQTKHFISPSVTVFRVIGHKNSQNTCTCIEKNGFLVKINTVPGVYKI
jgi:hypothetical protein